MLFGHWIPAMLVHLVQLRGLHSIAHPFCPFRGPHSRNDLAIDEAQRYRSVIPRISRPGKVVADQKHMALGNLITQKHVNPEPN